MRILHLLNHIRDAGNGIVNTAVDLAIEQSRKGHAVAMASKGGEYEALLKEAGVHHFTIDQEPKAKHLLTAALEVNKVLRSWRPDVVHAHMRMGLLLAWPWTRIFRIPLVAHLHNIHEHRSLLMGLADRVISVSHSVATTIEGQGIARRKIRIALNRTLGSPRQPSLSDIEPAQLQHPAIVTVGGMNHRKGIAELITAFDQVGEQFPSAHLYLVGSGPNQEEFETQAKQSRWHERIHFEGYQSQPQAYMLSADIFVLASRRESFGLVLIEAREASCAIVATDTDGIAEALDGGEAGVLVPPMNPEALTDALCSLLADEDERLLWKQRAHQGIDCFHVSAMETEINEIYAELVRDPRWPNVPDTVLPH